MRRAAGRVSGWLVLSFRDRVSSDVTATDHRFKLKQNMRQRPCAQDIFKIEHAHTETIIVCYTCVLFCVSTLSCDNTTYIYIYIYNNFPFAIIEINHLDMCFVRKNKLFYRSVCSVNINMSLIVCLQSSFVRMVGGGIKVSL